VSSFSISKFTPCVQVEFFIIRGLTFPNLHSGKKLLFLQTGRLDCFLKHTRHFRAPASSPDQVPRQLFLAPNPFLFDDEACYLCGLVDAGVPIGGPLDPFGDPRHRKPPQPSPFRQINPLTAISSSTPTRPSPRQGHHLLTLSKTSRAKRSFFPCYPDVTLLLLF